VHAFYTPPSMGQVSFDTRDHRGRAGDPTKTIHDLYDFMTYNREQGHLNWTALRSRRITSRNDS